MSSEMFDSTHDEASRITERDSDETQRNEAAGDTIPSPPPDGPYSVELEPPLLERGSWKVVDGELVPIPATESASRDWCDWGLDTGPRLRVKGWRDVEPGELERLPSGADPGDVREAHRRARAAIASGDSAAIAREFPDLLDSMHSGERGQVGRPVDWEGLVGALGASLSFT